MATSIAEYNLFTNYMLDEIFQYMNESLKYKDVCGMKSFEARIEFVKKLSWMIFNEETINWISSFLEKHKISKVFEIGAGKGLLASLMNHWETQEKYSFEWTATDPKLSHGTEDTTQRTIFEVEELDANAAVSKYGSSSQMMTVIWPGYTESWAGDAIKQFRLLSDGEERFVLYGGENEWGCTGDAAMFEELSTNWIQVDEFECPQWSGLNDLLILYKTK